MFRSITFIAVLLSSGLLGLSHAAVIVVKQDGTGDATSIQSALNSALNNDIVAIGDNGTYIEDITISTILAQAGIPAAPLLSITLRAAPGTSPSLQAANDESTQRMNFLDIPGKDMLGLVVWGCDNVVIEGIEIINLENTVNAFNVQSALVIADCQNITVENCTIRGPGVRSPGEGSGILIAGVLANPFRTDNVIVRNSTITETHYGIISAVFQKGSGTDPNHVTIEDCQFLYGFESGVDVDNAGEMIIRNCFFDGYNHGVHFAGGNSIVEDCIIVNSLQEGLESQVDTNWNDQVDGGIVRRCAFIGNGLENSGAGVRCTDGPLRFENCIIAGNMGPGIRITSGSTNDVSVVVDHCDIYENFGEFEVILEADGSQLAELIITNSNIVTSGSGILNESYLEAVTAHHNNVFVEMDDYINVDPADSLSVDPMYVSPGIDPDSFSFDGFQLQPGSSLLGAGESETVIGSQGQEGTEIKRWELF